MQDKGIIARQQKIYVYMFIKAVTLLKNFNDFKTYFCKSSPIILPVLNCDATSSNNTFLEQVSMAVTF
jgi:hypothetical protein